jgi:hypothetical protein
MKRQPVSIDTSAAAATVQQFWRMAMRTRSTSYKQRHAYPAEHAIRYWMRAPVVMVTFDAPLSDALALMREHVVIRFP